MTTHELPTFTGPNRTSQVQGNFLPEIVRRHVLVARVEDVTANYRRIVLTGEAMAGFPFVRFSNDHVKVNFPDPTTGRYRGYQAVGDGWEEEQGSSQMIFRDYTPRAYNPDTQELTLDFVVHDHGVAGLWARDAKPGDRLAVNGPRANWLLPENYRHYFAAGDETAIPVISRLIEEAPAGAQVTALIEVADADAEQTITPSAGVTLELRWVHRDSAAVGEGHNSALETAVRSAPLPSDLGELFVLAAGETGAMTPIRRYLRRDLGLPKERVEVDGYWKRGVADFDHHTVDSDDGV